MSTVQDVQDDVCGGQQNPNEIAVSHHGVTGQDSSNPRGKHWCFRFSMSKCPTVQELTTQLQEVSQEFVFQLEQGANHSKILHYQGVFSLPEKRARSDLLKNVFPYIELEQVKIGAEYLGSMRSTRAIDYCCKDDTRVEGPWGTKGYLGRQGVYDERKGEELGVMRRESLSSWMIWVTDVCKEKADKRTIHWLWSDKGGIGKTSLGKYLCFHKGALYIGQSSSRHVKSAIFKEKPGILVLGLPRDTVAERVCYKTLEEAKDGLFFSSFGVEGTGMCLMACPHIFVLANTPPCVEKMSKDRWNIIELGRCNESIISRHLRCL